MGHVGGFAAVLGLYLAAALAPAGAQTAETPRPRSQSASSNISVKVGTLEVRDLNFNTPGRGSWSIGRIGFTGFVRDGARVRADRIVIDRVVMTLGSRTTEIPSVVISGADLPEPLFRMLTAAESTSDLAGMLTSATIDEIAIDRIVQRDPSVQLEVVYTGFVMSGIKGGHVGSARVASTLVTAAGAPGVKKQMNVRTGEVRYQQFDLAEMMRMLTGGSSGGAKRILQRAVVDGVEVTTDQATLRINRAEVADIDGRAPAQALPAELNMDGGTGSGSLNPEQQKQAAAYASDILRFARIGRYHIEGISVSLPGRGGFSIGAITVGGLSKRGIERIEITGFDVRMPGAPLRFDRFELQGINYGALVDALLSAAGSGGKPDFSPAQVAQLMPRLSVMRLSRLDVETPQGLVALADLSFELAERGEATSTSSALSGLTIDLRRLDANDGRDKLIALGYGPLIADAQARVSWLPKHRALVVETVGLSLDRVGRLDVAARLENVDIEKAFADPMAAADVMSEAWLGPIQIRLANLGLAERFYADTARSAGLPQDAVRAGLAAEMRSQAVNSFGPLLAGRSADAIAEFLQSPGTITARIAPAAGQRPLTVAEIQSLAPPELMQRLAITLETEPK
ncbi:MAG: hypothetical protein GEU91_19035 [Rhizobiales bacterium]|nr:hypothetical protein [Hyphomicrobiales bacterium]